MFTGLIEETGTIKLVQPVTGGIRFSIRADKIMKDLNVDASVAVNGSCLTVEKITENSFIVTAVQETINRTTLKHLHSDDVVNLERAMRLSDRLDGHFVQGHVDGTGKIESINQTGVGVTLSIQLPENLSKYTIEKGSIAVDGISLTLAMVNKNRIQIAVIPHTFRATTLSRKRAGDLVNIETDMMGKYAERMFAAYHTKSTHDENWYRSQGY